MTGVADGVAEGVEESPGRRLKAGELAAEPACHSQSETVAI